MKETNSEEIINNYCPPRMFVIPEKMNRLNREKKLNKLISLVQLLIIFGLILGIKIYDVQSNQFIACFFSLFIFFSYIIFFGNGFSWILLDKIELAKHRTKNMRKPKRIILVRYIFFFFF